MVKKATVLKKIINYSINSCQKTKKNLRNTLLFVLFMPAYVASAEALKLDNEVWVFLGTGYTVNTENKGRIANVGFIETSQSGVIINTGISHNHAKQILRQVNDISNKKTLEAIVLQGDRKFALGASSLNRSGVATYAHPKTVIQMNERCITCIRYLEETLGNEMHQTQVDTPRNIAQMKFLPHLPLKDIVIINHGDTVSKGALMIYHAPSGILFSGDAVFSSIVPSIKDANLGAWKKSLKLLRDLPISFIIPGIGPILKKAAIDDSLSYLEALDISTTNLYSSNQDLLSATQNGGLTQFSEWGLYSEHHSNNVMYRYLQIEQNQLELEK